MINWKAKVTSPTSSLPKCESQCFSLKAKLNLNPALTATRKLRNVESRPFKCRKIPCPRIDQMISLTVFNRKYKPGVWECYLQTPSLRIQTTSLKQTKQNSPHFQIIFLRLDLKLFIVSFVFSRLVLLCFSLLLKQFYNICIL